MSAFKETFKDSKAVLPVIHVQNTEHAIRNAAVAKEAGADGVFLISMEGMPYYELSNVVKTVKAEVNDLWVGANYLDLPVIHAFQGLTAEDGVWTDRSHIDEKVIFQAKAEMIADTRDQSRWKGLYFGGVAFKYVTPEVSRKDLGLAAQVATGYMDVVTTSGDKTGSAPDTEKIQIMKAAIGEFPLGIASGISPDNVHNFRDYADAFLVATSLLKPSGHEEFDPARVKALVEAVRG